MFADSKPIARLAHLILVFAIAWLVSAHDARAQESAGEKAEWHGKVVDESGLPIEGIVVEVMDAAGRPLLEARSDQEGKFSFAAAAAAKLRVTHPHFEPVEQSLGSPAEAVIVSLKPGSDPTTTSRG